MELYQNFKFWWRINYPSTKIPSKSDFTDFLKKKFKTNYVKNKLKGYILLENVEEKTPEDFEVIEIP